MRNLTFFRGNIPKISNIQMEKSVFTFHAEIQDGRQKKRESDFCEKSPVHSGQPGVKNFDEIPLSRTVKETEANLCFSIFGENSKIHNGRHF